MKANILNYIIEHCSVFVDIAEAMSVCLVFVSGLGRYRVVLVYAVFCLINSLLAIGKPGRKVPYVLLPATLVAIYLDIDKGPFHPILLVNSLLIALPLMLLMDNLVKHYSMKAIEMISEGHIFLVCPKCNYDNKDLVAMCSYCSYKTGEHIGSNPLIKNIHKSIPIKVLRMLQLKSDEVIIFYIRLFPFRSVVKNGERQIRTHFIITNHNVVFLDYFFFSESWREKDVIPLNNVASIEGKMKKIYLSKEPFFEIITLDNVTYEIIFKKFDKYNEYFAAISEAIRNYKMIGS
jgi:hypothetical protein